MFSGPQIDAFRGQRISGHYLYGVRERMRGKANVIGESSMRDNSWAKMGPRFYRSNWASKADELMADLIAQRLSETLAALPRRQ